MRDLNAAVDTRSQIDKLVDSALDVSVKSKSPKKTKLSPSMFPICSVKWFMQLYHQERRGFLDAQSSTMLNIFADSGIAAHKHLQNALGYSGQMHGNWVCVNRECSEYPKTKSVYDDKGKRTYKGRATRYRSENNICPTCKSIMEYKELLVLYRGVKGYVDAVIKNPDGTYSLLDIKSATVDKAINDKALNSYQKLQILAYAYILKKRYGYNIVDYTLTYIPRDNPKKFKSYTFAFDSDAAREAKSIIRRELKKWRVAVDGAKTKKLGLVEKYKPCKSEDQYWSEVHTYVKCPILGVCFSSAELYSKLKQFMVLSDANPDLSLGEIIGILFAHQPRAKGLGLGDNKRKRIPVKNVSI